MKVIDQIGETVHISNPQRIISLVPSITELLFDLGLEERLIGRTKFCIHPSNSINDVIIIGGTKNVNIEKVIQLRPDLIIANKEENVKEQVESFQAQCPVWISDVTNFSSSMNMIEQLGKIFDRKDEAQSIVNRSLQFITSKKNKTLQKAIYLIWKDPFMTIGGDTYIHDMMHHLGFENVFGNKKRYPVINLSTMKSLQPDVVLLSSEPYPFKAIHVNEIQKYLPHSEVRLADGELFSWYGSRLIHK